jgi:hypothetical protein
MYGRVSVRNLRLSVKLHAGLYHCKTFTFKHHSYFLDIEQV